MLVLPKNFKTNNVIDMKLMSWQCYSLRTLVLSEPLIISPRCNIENIFKDCDNLEVIHLLRENENDRQKLQELVGSPV